jgi:bifunctional ADP-heptose synthase (sugar kinase/adenylyltransferase)
MQIDINSIAKEYRKKNILVVGDIILDAYVYGKVDRISQEAPVPIVSIERQEFKPGGAANVALNLSGLGAAVKTVTMIN